MDNDQRDRRDWPEPDGTTEPAEDDEPSSAEESRPVEPADASPDVAPAEPAPTPEWGTADATTDPSISAAEIESWPSQDASAEGAPSAADDTPAWPTEPPAAGSAADDSWPTTAPERGDEPVLAPDDATEPPPSEIEAYPAEPDAGDGESVVPPLPASAVAASTAAHAVPETESATGESMLCPRCGTENRPGLAFCRSCGQRLVAAGVATTIERPGTPEGTQACPRCGTHNRSGVAFCQNCGANLRGTAPGYVPPTVAAGDAKPETPTAAKADAPATSSASKSADAGKSETRSTSDKPAATGTTSGGS